MSVVTLKFVYVIAVWLLCFCLYAETCNAQSASVHDTTELLKQYNTSLKKSPSSKWSLLKKNKKSKINREVSPSKNNFTDISKTTQSIRKKSEKKELNKSFDKLKTGNTFSSGSDTLKKKSKNKNPLKDTIKETMEEKLGAISEIIPDSLEKETTKKQFSDQFSEKKIENTLNNSLPLGDYKMEGDLFKKNKYGTDKKKAKAIAKDKKSKIAGRLRINESINPLKKNIDSAKLLNVYDMIKKQLTSNIKGSVSLGYEYGILPYIAPDKYPVGAFKSEGRLSLIVLNLPVEVIYRYTTIKSVTGINNYFRISYDASRYKEELDKKLAVKDQLKKLQLDKFQLNKQDIAMKMEYMKMLSNITIPELSVPDTSLNVNGKLPNSLDSIKALSFSNSRLNYSRKKDSLLRETAKYKAQYDTYKAKYDSLSEAIEKISKLSQDIKQINTKGKVPGIPDANGKISGSSIVTKIQEKLNNIKKFEIGLCNPSYSLFLLSNVPLKGINMEYASKDHFFAITYGTTLTTILYNPNTLQGKMQGVRNLYSFFDYNDLSVGRKILAIKGGQGQKEGTHLFVGVLIGKGKIDYVTTTDPKFGQRESNLVVELDGKYKFSEQLSAEAVFGKSSLQSEDVSLEQIKKSFSEVFSSYRSNALQAKINYDIQKTKTKIQLTGRLIDPYFKSFGVSFLRSDNIRYEIKADQTITKNIKYSVAFRSEEDNLLGLINYKNTFRTITNSLNVKIKRGLTMRLNYSPLLRTLRNGNTVAKDRNAIATAILFYVPKMRNTQSNFNILYSKYRITSDSGNIHFDNITYTHQFQFKSGFKTGLNVSWFKNTLIDTVNNNTYLGIVDIGYTTEKQNSFTVGGKVAYKSDVSTEYGFIAKVTLKIYNSIFWEAEAEKILTGDYYISLIDNQIKKFPYYISNKVIINF